MSFGQKVVVRILLLAAKMHADSDELRKEITALANHISVGAMPGVDKP